MIVPEFRTARGANNQLVEAVTIPEHGCEYFAENFGCFSCYVKAGDSECLNGRHELLVIVMCQVIHQSFPLLCALEGFRNQINQIPHKVAKAVYSIVFKSFYILMCILQTNCNKEL